MPDEAPHASWYLVQYTADLRAREPRNVGVVLQTPDGWMARFYAEKAPGEIDGHRLKRLHLQKQSYEAWIQYYRRKLSEGAWSDVERAQQRRRGNFAAALGGHIAQDIPAWDAELDRLYLELVSPDTSGPDISARGMLRERAAAVLRAADIVPLIHVPTEADFGAGQRVRVNFDFAYQNGQLHLMDALALAGPNGAVQAQAFNGRASAVRKAGTGQSFFAFYDHAQLDSGREDLILSALEGVAHTLDLSDPDSAVETLKSVAGG